MAAQLLAVVSIFSPTTSTAAACSKKAARKVT